MISLRMLGTSSCVVILATLLQSIAWAESDGQLLLRTLSQLRAHDSKLAPSITNMSHHRIVAVVVDGNEVVSRLGSPHFVIAEEQNDGTLRLLESFPSGVEAGLSYRFEGETIVLRMSNAHHGLYSRTFRIRLIQNRLMIVSVSQQALELTDDGREAWSGNFVDLLSSRAEVWGTTFSLDDSRHGQLLLQAMQDAFDRESPPTKRTRFTISLRGARPQPLARLHQSSPDGLYPCEYVDSSEHLRRIDSPHCVK